MPIPPEPDIRCGVSSLDTPSGSISYLNRALPGNPLVNTPDQYCEFFIRAKHRLRGLSLGVAEARQLGDDEPGPAEMDQDFLGEDGVAGGDGTAGKRNVCAVSGG